MGFPSSPDRFRLTLSGESQESGSLELSLLMNSLVRLEQATIPALEGQSYGNAPGGRAYMRHRHYRSVGGLATCDSRRARFSGRRRQRMLPPAQIARR